MLLLYEVQKSAACICEMCRMLGKSPNSSSKIIRIENVRKKRIYLAF